MKIAKNSLRSKNGIVIILILIYSCTSNKQEIVKDKNGNIILECELKNGVRDGKCHEYYPNGATKSISSWIAGVQNGQRIEYFENGQIQETSMWKDDKLEGERVQYSTRGYIHEVGYFIEGIPEGLFVHYYEGTPRRAVQYVGAKDHQQYANQWWIYDYCGDVRKEESHYYSIYSEKGDSVRIGDPGEIKVKLEAPCFGEYMKLVSGKFDGKFNPVDSSEPDTINCAGFEGTVKYQFDEKGLQVIRGIILDGKKEKGTDEKGAYTRTYQREIYFTKTFEVY